MGRTPLGCLYIYSKHHSISITLHSVSQHFDAYSGVILILRKVIAENNVFLKYQIIILQCFLIVYCLVLLGLAQVSGTGRIYTILL